MSIELKPCPFCGGRAERIEIREDDGFNNRGGGVIECQKCFASSHVEFGRMENLVSSWNTRATPSADTLAGLRQFKCRTDNLGAKMIESADGGYVLHYEAAKIVAEKDAEIEHWKGEAVRRKQCVEQLQEELAQIKAQKPVGW